MSVRMDPITLVMIVAIAYLLYKVNQLDRLVRGRGKGPGPRPTGQPFPILKENIEPGPFARKKE